MKTAKPLIFTIVFFCIVLALVIYRYERVLRQDPQIEPVAGGFPANKKYTAGEIVALIKAGKDYLGDSITIFDDGQMMSSNGKFQGTLNAVVNTEANMNIVRANTKANRLPIQYNIYVLAASYYRQQYPGKQ